MEEEIKNFVEENSYFILQDEDLSEGIYFSTRMHGSIFNEQYGPADYVEANRIKDLLQVEFPDWDVDINTCDEWVNLEIFKRQ